MAVCRYGTCFEAVGGYTMYRRTYISKVLEELAATGRKIEAMRQAGKYVEAQETLERFYKSVFPEAGASFLEESPEQIISWSQLGTAVLEPVAEVLCEEAELLGMQGKQQEASKRGKKALTLLKYLDETDTRNYSLNRKHRIQALQIKYD